MSDCEGFRNEPLDFYYSSYQIKFTIYNKPQESTDIVLNLSWFQSQTRVVSVISLQEGAQDSHEDC